MTAIIIKQNNHDKVLQSKDKKRELERKMRKIESHSPYTSSWMKNIKSRTIDHPEGKPENSYNSARKKYIWDGEKLVLVRGIE